MASFGEEVKRLAAEKGLTQKALADACGVNQAFISMLVRGERDRLGADVLFKLSAALGVSCSHFQQFLAPTTLPPAQGVEVPTTTAPAKKTAKGKKK